MYHYIRNRFWGVKSLQPFFSFCCGCRMVVVYFIMFFYVCVCSLTATSSSIIMDRQTTNNIQVKSINVALPESSEHWVALFTSYWRYEQRCYWKMLSFSIHDFRWKITTQVFDFARQDLFHFRRNCLHYIFHWWKIIM